MPRHAWESVLSVVNKLGTGAGLTCEVWVESRDWHLKNVDKKGIEENGKESSVDIDLSLYYGKYLSEHGINS